LIVLDGHVVLLLLVLRIGGEGDWLIEEEEEESEVNIHHPPYPLLYHPLTRVVMVPCE